MERKESEVKEIIEEGKKYEKLLDLQMRIVVGDKSIIEVEGKDRIYYLLKTDGLKLHPAGYFLVENDKMRFGQLFYAFVKIQKENDVYDDIHPFVVEVTYKNKEIEDVKINPLEDLSYIDLGETVATFEKKSRGVSSLPTQLPFEVVTKIFYRTNLIQNPLEELRKIYENLKEKIKKHIDQDDTIINIALCWSIATYWYEVFGVIPILSLIGVSGSGKTKFATAICYISKKGLPIADPTDTNITRVIDGFKPTLLIDDWDEVMRKKKEIANSILKHVYKSTITVPRLKQVKNSFVVELFSPYAPVILTTAEPIESPQLQRRMIELQCRKSERPFPNVGDYNPYFLSLYREEREKLYEIMFILTPIVFEKFHSLDINLQHPHSEIWSPVLTIAKLLGDDVFNEIYEYAKKITEEKEEEVYKEEKTFLQAISLFFKQQNLEGKNVEVVEFTASELKENLMKIVVDELKEMDEIQFTKYYTPQRIGSILKRMGIKSIRKGGKGERKKVVTRKEFNEFCKKFGVKLSTGENITECIDTDNSDNSDNTIHMPEKNNIEKTQEKPGKNGNLEQEKNPGVHIRLSDLSESSDTIFSLLKNSIYAECSYCRKLTYIKYKDRDGNYICDICKNLLENQDEYFDVDEYE